MNDAFERFATWIDEQTTRPITFVAACLSIVVWLVCGPIFDFSDTWQLVINTSTTVITFLMVFLLANSQSRAQARHYQLTEQTKVLEERVIALEGKILDEVKQ
jgi:low affinity Fe/Cu permease